MTAVCTLFAWSCAKPAPPPAMIDIHEGVVSFRLPDNWERVSEGAADSLQSMYASDVVQWSVIPDTSGFGSGSRWRIENFTAFAPRGSDSVSLVVTDVAMPSATSEEYVNRLFDRQRVTAGETYGTVYRHRKGLALGAKGTYAELARKDGFRFITYTLWSPERADRAVNVTLGFSPKHLNLVATVLDTLSATLKTDFAYPADSSKR